MLNNMLMRRSFLPIAFGALLLAGCSTQPMPEVPPQVFYNDDRAVEDGLLNGFTHRPDYKDNPRLREIYLRAYAEGEKYGVIAKKSTGNFKPAAGDERGNQAWYDGFIAGWMAGFQDYLASKRQPAQAQR